MISGTLTILEFLVGADSYAVPLDCVREVIRPSSPEVSSEELPLLPITAAIGLNDDPTVRFNRGVVLDTVDGLLVLLVQRVVGVRNVDAGRMLNVPPCRPPRTREAVRGLLLEDDRIAVVLRPERLFMQRPVGEARG